MALDLTRYFDQNREALSELSSPLSPESRQAASLLSSKIYFYLGSLEEAVDAALSAGSAFARDAAVTPSSSASSAKASATREFQETIIARCLDRAILQRGRGDEVDERLKAIIEEVLEGNIALQQVEGAGSSKLVSQVRSPALVEPYPPLPSGNRRSV